MKKTLLIAILLTSSVSKMFAQQTIGQQIPLIGEYAPSFTSQSTSGEISFPEIFMDKWKILFSHPADFTPVCSSEIIELSNMQDDFKKLNTVLVVLSTDGLNSHIEWIKSLEALRIEGKPTAKINFPFVSDVDLSISRKYGMIHELSSTTQDIRGVFIIDPDNRIAAIFYYPNTIGRNLGEIKRTLIALQTARKYSVLTPANWQSGDDVMIPSPKSLEESSELEKKQDDDMYMHAWYMWYKKLPNANK
jgi:peroxiredoxin (alkyl hydroperoxide reductase subunit C)